ncbi:MAG: RsfS/YbeB/iojap family protein, partial [Paramuribaculum sp.]|nr:RsfS/YbeB/iojap family protein [Paramuribaculum sp.]
MTQKRDIVQLITEGIQDKKGKRIVCLDLSGIETAAASNFIICEGTSTMQVGAIADNIRDHLLEEGGIKPYNYCLLSPSQSTRAKEVSRKPS